MFRKFNAQIYFNEINIQCDIKRRRSMISDRILYKTINVIEKTLIQPVEQYLNYTKINTKAWNS